MYVELCLCSLSCRVLHTTHSTGILHTTAHRARPHGHRQPHAQRGEGVEGRWARECRRTCIACACQWLACWQVACGMCCPFLGQGHEHTVHSHTREADESRKGHRAWRPNQVACPVRPAVRVMERRERESARAPCEACRSLGAATTLPLRPEHPAGRAHCCNESRSLPTDLRTGRRSTPPCSPAAGRTRHRACAISTVGDGGATGPTGRARHAASKVGSRPANSCRSRPRPSSLRASVRSYT